MSGTQTLKELDGTPVAAFSIGVAPIPIRIEWKPYETPSPLLVVQFSGPVYTDDEEDVSVSGWSATRREIAEYEGDEYANLVFSAAGTIDGDTVTFAVAVGTASETEEHQVAFTGVDSNLVDANGNPIEAFSLRAPKIASIAASGTLTTDVTFDADLDESFVIPPLGVMDLMCTMGDMYYGVQAGGVTVPSARVLRIVWVPIQESVGDPNENVAWYDCFSEPGHVSLYAANGMAMPSFSFSLTDTRSAVVSAVFNQSDSITFTFEDAVHAGDGGLKADVDYPDTVADAGGDFYLLTDLSPSIVAGNLVIAAASSVEDVSPARATFLNTHTGDGATAEPQVLDSKNFPVIPFTDFPVTT